MKRSILIVGAGPAAAAAALATVQRPDVQVTVIDLGTRLEEAHERARAKLAVTPPAQWHEDDLKTISRQPVASATGGLPEKRSFGSDFPFRDRGQVTGMSSAAHVHDALVSSAYGGFSNVWGAQVMPFTAASFRDWPIPVGEMYRNYEAILREIPFAAEDDDLAELFPLLAPSADLPQLSSRSVAVLGKYSRRRAGVNSLGVTLGRARLAMKAGECVRCGLCLTGCPYCLIYSASQTLSRLRREGRIEYHDGLLAVRVEEGPDSATVVAKELSTDRLQRFEADRVLLACGGIGTSRLVMGSLGLSERAVSESAQFVLPFLSASRTPDPRDVPDFTLNQFNMAINMDEDGHDVSQLHFYTYNSAFLDAFPSPLQGRGARSARTALLRRLSVALGYLPSWASPSFTLRAQTMAGEAALPDVTLRGERPRFLRNPMLRRVISRVSRAAPYLDLWPALPLLRMSPRGKSYHWGGTFPHSTHPVAQRGSDVLGRVDPWRRVHLVDASVFPTVPATTFTLTVMANSHRIAESVLEELV